MKLDFAGKNLLLDSPQVMGVLNVTPDSFSDGGRFVSPAKALLHARQMVREGATIIDVGGESTRPGADKVTVQQELDRVIPVIESICGGLDVVVSVDTSTPEVMDLSVRAGAGLINDVRALQRPGALEMAASLDVPVCLMHMQGQPGTMQEQPDYQDVVAEVLGFLDLRIKRCVGAGIAHSNILVDPGFGFGKSLRHNLQLLDGLVAFSSLGVPLLVGMSRKSMIGAVLGRTDASERLFGSLAAAMMAVERGAHIVRVHDVQATCDVLAMLDAVNKCEKVGE